MPLVESPWAVLALLLAAIALAAIGAAFVQWRGWFRDRAMYDDDPIPPPNVRSQRYEPSDLSRGYIE